MYEFTLTPEVLIVIAGAVLSLAFRYIPGLTGWYDKLASEWKQLIMAGLLLLVSVAVFLLSCYKLLNGVTCDQGGMVQLVYTYILAIMANQGVYAIIKPHKAEEQPKALEQPAEFPC